MLSVGFCCLYPKVASGVGVSLGSFARLKNSVRKQGTGSRPGTGKKARDRTRIVLYTMVKGLAL